VFSFLVYIYLRNKHLATIAQRVVLSIPYSIRSVYAKEINAHMTPQEKAKELVDKMYATQGPENGITEHEAKQCALIAVDEIIKNGFNPQLQYNYWQEVKQEIQKL
jgi:hypothetical protein